MTKKYRFYSGSIGDSRTYDQADWAEFLQTLFSDGVIYGYLDTLEVTISSTYSFTFTGGSVEVIPGDVLSIVAVPDFLHATVISVSVTSGSWAGHDAAGTIYYTSSNWGTGTFLKGGSPAGTVVAISGHANIAPGAAWNQGNFIESDAIESLTIDPNGWADNRYDLVVLRNNLTTGIAPFLIKGTTVSVYPSATTDDVPLAYIVVPHTFSILNTVEDERSYSSTNDSIPETIFFADTDLDMDGQSVINSGPAAGGKDGMTKGDIDGAAALYYPLPSGAVVGFGTATLPAGFLKADGSAVSRATYAALFGAIGTIYGAGDGTTTFNLPSMTGKTVIGHSGSGDYYYLGATGGLTTVTLSMAEMTNHAHGESYGSGSGAGAASSESAYLGPAGSGTTDSKGSGTAHDNMAPYIVECWGIKI